MTIGLRRGPRRRDSNHLSHQLAAIRRHRAASLGTIKVHLLGQDRLREVVAVAIFLNTSHQCGIQKSLSRVTCLKFSN